MRLLLLASLLAPVTSFAQPSPPARADLIARTERLLDSLGAAGVFSGVVAIAHDGEPVFARAIGMADRESGRPNTTETAFNLGSINKLFTAIAIRQLEAAGRLHRDSALAVYWPDYPNDDIARRITIAQLLQHRSGIGGNIFAVPAGGSRQDVRHNNDVLPLFVDAPLQFEPGTDQRYSNAGYVVLGALVERLSGVDYYEYIDRHIYEPAGMTNSGHHPVDALPAGVATGYTSGEDRTGPIHSNSTLLPGRGSAAGGGYSTAADLLSFIQALRDGRVPAGVPPGIGAAGGAPGVNAVIEGDLPGGYDVVVLANVDPPAAEEVATRIRGWLGATE